MSCGLRDVLELEGLDTPAVLVASDAFVQAADEQAQQLGQPEIRARASSATPCRTAPTTSCGPRRAPPSTTCWAAS